MAIRFLVMCSLMIVELGLGISSLLGVSSQYPHHSMDEPGIAGCVMIVAILLGAWLMTIAFFVRGSSAAKGKRIVETARAEAAKIVSEAMDKVLALNSLDSGRCRQCGNPRTGKFCPRCGVPGEAIAAAA